MLRRYEMTEIVRPDSDLMEVPQLNEDLIKCEDGEWLPRLTGLTSHSILSKKHLKQIIQVLPVIS